MICVELAIYGVVDKALLLIYFMNFSILMIAHFEGYFSFFSFCGFFLFQNDIYWEHFEF